MELKQKRIDFSFVKVFNYLLEFSPVLLLICGILLFDSLEIMFYGYGIRDTDFSDFISPSAIPFLLLYLVVFGIIAAGLSSYVKVAAFKLGNCIIFKYKERTKSKPEIARNSIIIDFLYEIALITENSFLLEYINKEIFIVFVPPVGSFGLVS